MYKIGIIKFCYTYKYVIKKNNNIENNTRVFRESFQLNSLKEKETIDDQGTNSSHNQTC